MKFKKNLSRFTSFFLLIFSLFIFLYVFYRSEIIFNGSRNYNLYYALSIALIILSTISFSIKIKIEHLIASIILILGFYSMELYLIYKKEYLDIKILKNKIEIYEKKNNQKFDIRTKKKIYKDIKNKNKNLSVTESWKFFLRFNDTNIFPLSGVSNVETINCNENGFYSTYLSDRYGFNNIDTAWESKKVDYLLVGDSFVHGSCVNRPFDIASQIIRLSNNQKNVISLGYAGNGPLAEYATLKEYFPEAEVKNILWFYYEGNDLNDLDYEKKINFFLQYLKFDNHIQDFKNKNKKLKLDQYIQSKIDEVYLSFDSSRFIKLSSLRETIIPKKLDFLKNKDINVSSSTKVTNENLNLLKKVFYKAYKFSEDNNANFYIIILPDIDRYLSKNKKKYSINEVKAIARDLNIKFIDIDLEVFDKEINPKDLFPFKMEGHYNIKGYKKISDSIYNFIK